MQMPATKPVARQKRGGTTYHLFPDGQLWTAGRYAHFCGYVANPEDLDFAIDTHEEELAYLMAGARAEFGL